ncbi:MAG: TatD family hydrolase [Candidatus Staskawiczbacteria bacterium]|nr:TatD family hydrolase [Candidatus Staskawiczbacteria bacterium]
MIIDTHSHLNFEAFKKDSDEVIKRTLGQNIWLINVGTRYETSEEAVKIAEKYKEGVYAAIGLHPIYAGTEFVKIKTDQSEGEFLTKEQGFDKEKYKELAKSKKAVAIGEIGLDYYYRPKTNAKLHQFKDSQKKVFIEQLELAEELNLPVIVHCRMAHADILDILKSKTEKLRGVIHCFTGTEAEMEEYLKLGFYIGLNGIIFKLNMDEAIKQCPPDRILVETDCPYLTPLPAEVSAKAGPKGYVRNEPVFIKYIIQKISNLKGISFEKIAKITTQNAQQLFKI